MERLGLRPYSQDKDQNRLKTGVAKGTDRMRTDGAEVCCSDILKVLANDVRLRVVQQLLSGPKTVGEINRDMGVEKSLLSHHLKQLRSHGIVKTQREGKSIRYELSPGIAISRKGDGLNLGCCKLVFLDNR